MQKFGKSQSVARREDMRFLTGTGSYLDDSAPAGALVAYALRSPVAHGVITALDVTDAEEMPGVALVLTAERLQAAGVEMGMKAILVKNQDGSDGAAPYRPLMAQTHVRFAGEIVALIVAETLNQAKDAAEAVELEIDDLPVHLGLNFDGPDIHPGAPGNLAFDFAVGDTAATQAAMDGAAHVVTLDVPDTRITVNAMEPRGCWGQIEDDRLHFCFGGQGVWGMKADLARHLGMATDDIRVTHPDVGGGFGMKVMAYPEYFAVAHAVRVLGRAVKWVPDRAESMLSDHAGRDLTSRAALAFDKDLKLQAYRVENIANMGAYNSFFAQPIQAELFSKVFTGVYQIPHASMRTRGVYSNTNVVDAYRGAGRPEAIYVIERAMDHAARELGVDPWDLRQRNFIPSEAFPYPVPCGVSYDVGDYARVLKRLRDEADLIGFAARREASQAKGKLRGLGLCYYVESILGAPTETARLVFEDGGAVTMYVGTQSNGQGHETAYAQFVADHTGLDPATIQIVQGDSDAIPSGGGTGGSRSMTIQGTALLKTTDKIITEFAAFLADEQGVAATQVEFDDEVFRINGSNTTFAMIDLAEMAREAGRNDLLDQSATVELIDKSFPNGGHVAEVEIDPETGVTQVVKYSVTDDFGNLINPMLVAGQIHGGVAQGLGQVLMERTVFDQDGQLLSGSFMDYAMPRADDMPFVHFTNEVILSPRNPLGMKGCGEAGTIGAMAAVVNAVNDAIAPLGAGPMDMPITPHRLWQHLQDQKAG